MYQATQHSIAALNYRLLRLFAVFVALAATAFGRLVTLEIRDGDEYRAVAAEPLVREHTVAAVRGRILARDGTVLAQDRPTISLAVNYRWLEETADPRWLRRMARAKLTSAQRRDPANIATAEQQLLSDRREVAAQLANLCGLSVAEWCERTQRIQQRVEALADSVNSRRQRAVDAKRQESPENDSEVADSTSWSALIGRSIADALFASEDPPPPAEPIAEELTEHVVCENISLDVVAEIESHPRLYPGVKLVHSYRREYPQGDLAANTVGYLGRVNAEEVRRPSPSGRGQGEGADDQHDFQPPHPKGEGEYFPDDWLGRTGVERQYERVLRAQRGVITDRLDTRGAVYSSTTVREPSAGRDLVLTIDPALQRTAQTLLDQAIARRLPSGISQLDAAAGGAVVALDINTGAILAEATAPRFNPNDFVGQNNAAINRWLSDPARPLFDRNVQMALPPGSVFKIVSAVALLACGANPQAPVECQGYLHQPDALRCAIFRRYGIGHGPVTLADALARSCNVYFFHEAEQYGAGPLVDWARRFQFGLTTGVDLPGEAGGNIPTIRPATAASSVAQVSCSPGEMNLAAFDPRLIAVGQGPVTATPLQIVRMTAAIANGGFLVTPHLGQRIVALPDDNTSNRKSDRASRQFFNLMSPVNENELSLQPPHRIPGLTGEMLAAIRTGLRQAVADDEGTAHDTVELTNVAIAGKTGTAETGPGQPEHAWFAGYAPADRPRVAYVVVIEYAGNAATSAGPVAQNLVKRMDKLGYFTGGTTQ